MNTIHIHEILDIIYSSGKTFTISSLKEEVQNIYGEDVLFMSCSDHHFGIEDMVHFMLSRGKIDIKGETIFPAGDSFCEH
jgi:probable metal-binding protein